MKSLCRALATSRQRGIHVPTLQMTRYMLGGHKYHKIMLEYLALFEALRGNTPKQREKRQKVRQSCDKNEMKTSTKKGYGGHLKSHIASQLSMELEGWDNEKQKAVLASLVEAFGVGIFVLLTSNVISW